VNLISPDESVVLIILGENSKARISGGMLSESAAQAGMIKKKDINTDSIIADIVFMIVKNLTHWDKAFA